MNTLRILVLESDDNLNFQIIEILKNNDFYVDVCTNNNEFLECIYNNLYDLYLININEKSLPRFQLIQLLNEYKDMTMKMVIASIPNIIKPSFLSGCDECIIKNIDEQEIILRIKALIRRQFKVYSDSIYLKNNIEYKIFTKKVLINKNEVILGEKPLLILDYLLKFRGYFVSSEDLENGVYPANSSSKNGSIRFHIHKIRQLIGNDIIVSNRTNGYKINI
ncbi:MAG: winged helix-turn-helix domain-containing protein [Aliarcobacter sp.]|uniref:Signal transduction response regulator n=1 Tax=Arcobacter aquimarinus TaxID=1315211 RepID=A0AAE7B6N0_9BACT|nr:winged helix-turn-helix domain-containing protein [Arcobacter aquimarinus]QKE26630.1 signal transduction response regulator [Arcobacter aquimarinus]RXI36549.1 helix-turn-helix domain-containing protein [Arcobacter aquimarinus]